MTWDQYVWHRMPVHYMSSVCDIDMGVSVCVIDDGYSSHEDSVSDMG